MVLLSCSIFKLLMNMVAPKWITASEGWDYQSDLQSKEQHIHNRYCEKTDKVTCATDCPTHLNLRHSLAHSCVLSIWVRSSHSIPWSDLYCSADYRGWIVIHQEAYSWAKHVGLLSTDPFPLFCTSQLIVQLASWNK